jgi:plastocyanin
MIPRRLQPGVFLVLLIAIPVARGAEETLVVGPGADGVQRASLVLDSYSYTPKRLVVRAGKPVELSLHNVSTLAPHNFVVADPAAGFKVNKDVSAGKTARVSFVPPHAGIFVFYCDKRLLFFKSHRDNGMEGVLEVR